MPVINTLPRRLFLVIGVAIVATMILAACKSGGSSPTPSPATTQTPTPTATDTPAPTPSPTHSPTLELTPTPTPEPVVSPCEAVPALPTVITDPEDLYTVSVPDGWVVAGEEGPLGVRISRIVVESPDFSKFVDEAAEGPFTPIHYETGATFVIHAINVQQEPPYHYGGVTSESEVTIDGEVAPYHVFLEPSTASGQLLDAHRNHDGNYFLFRLEYNPETCPAGEDLFNAILDSFQFQ